MVFNKTVLWTKVASALEGLTSAKLKITSKDNIYLSLNKIQFLPLSCPPSEASVSLILFLLVDL